MPLFAPRGPSGWFPHSSLLLRHSDSSPPHFALLLALLGGSGPLTRECEASQVAGEPLHTCPGSPTPEDARAQGPGMASLRFELRASRCCLPSRSRCRRPATLILSGLNSAASMLPVHASWPRSPLYCLRPRKTRSRLATLHLAGRDFHPRVTIKGFSCYMPPSFPAAGPDAVPLCRKTSYLKILPYDNATSVGAGRTTGALCENCAHITMDHTTN